MMHINLVNKKLVKPSSPTPPNLKNYKFSFIDEFVVLLDFEVGVLLFYGASTEYKQPQAMFHDFEESLSKVLVQFYPLAGRFVMKDRYIDCSDQGAELVGATAPDVELATLITERDLGNLAGFFPRKTDYVDEATYPLLSIQVTQLKCGGVVIGISVSHKIFDASSLATFVAAWSSATRLGNTSAITPTLGVSSALFPLKNWTKGSSDQTLLRIYDSSRVCVKRFTFNKAAIGEMRSKLRPREGNREWSRVRVVSSFIAKALIGVDRVKRGGVSRRCYIPQVVNFRERTVPPLPKHSCGNLALSASFETDETGVEGLLDAMSECIDRRVADCARLLCVDEDELHKLLAPASQGLELIQAAMSGEISTVAISDWSKFGFYETDFGWGRPAWATIIPLRLQNTAVLMENAERGGIEAWLHLDRNDMPLFEQDEDIKLLANISMEVTTS